MADDSWDAWFGTSGAPDSSWTYSMPEAGDLLRFDPSYTGKGLLDMYPGLGTIGAMSVPGGSGTMPDTTIPNLVSNAGRNPYLAALETGRGGATPTAGGGEGGFWASSARRVLDMIQKNPAAALALLGAGGAGLAGTIGGSDKIKLPGDLKSPAARATANPMDDPNAQTRYAEMKQQLDTQMRRDIGPGWETSTPGIQALQKLNQSINADIYQRSQGNVQNAQVGLGTLGSLYGQQQARKSQEQSNLFNLAGLLGTIGLGSLSGFGFAR